MTVIRLGPFRGAMPAIRPKLLPEGAAVESLNHWPDQGDLRPWRVPLTVATAASNTKTIHMLGRDSISDSIIWFEWTTVVHAIRSFRADDTTTVSPITWQDHPARPAHCAIAPACAARSIGSWSTSSHS